MKILIALAALLLTWQDNSTNESGFTIERQLNGGAFAVLATVGVNAGSYTDTTAIASTTDSAYCYRVKGFNATEQSGYTNTACKTIPALPNPVPVGLAIQFPALGVQ